MAGKGVFKGELNALTTTQKVIVLGETRTEKKGRLLEEIDMFISVVGDARRHLALHIKQEKEAQAGAYY